MKKIVALLTVILLLIAAVPLSGTAYADSNQASVGQFGMLGSIGGPTSAIAVSGNYVFVGKGSSIIVLECIGGRLAQKGKQLKLPSYVSDLKVSGSMLYAADGSAGLYIVSIADPLNPKEVGVYATIGFAEAVTIVGTKAYLANGYEGLQILDVSSPASPKELGKVYSGKYAFAVAVSGNYAYIAAADDGLLVANVTDGVAPMPLAVHDTPGVARNVVVSGSYAYVADDWKGVAVFSLSKPAAPALVRTISTAGRANGVAVSGNTLFVADAYMGLRVFDITNLLSLKDLTSFVPANSQLMRVVVRGGYAYCADRSNGVFCFDVKTPSSIVLKGLYSHTLPLPLSYPAGLSTWDNADTIARLLVLGIVTGKIDPDRAITRAEFAQLLCNSLKAPYTPGAPTFADVPASHWAYKYVQTVVRLGLMTCKDAKHFAPNGTLSYGEVVTSLFKALHWPASVTSSPAACVKEADRLGFPSVLCRYDMKSSINRANAFALMSKVIMEIPDKKTRQPLLQSKFGIVLSAAPMEIVDVAVKGTYAYAAADKAGLSVIDISDSTNPRQVAHLDFSQPIMYTEVYGQYVYALSTNTVNVVNIADPLHPITVLSRFDNVGGPVRGLDIDSGKMYIADEWGYKVYSLSDPAKLPLLCSHSFVTDVRNFHYASSDIAVRNGIAYIPYEQSGLKIYDLSDPKNCKLIATYNDPESDHPLFYANVQFEGNIAYVNCNGEGMFAFDISNIKNPKLISRITGYLSTQFNFRMGFYQNLALIPNDRCGVRIVDVSDSANVKTVADTDTPGIPVNIRVSGDLAYIADGIGGLGILKLSSKATPLVPPPAAVSPVGAINLKMPLFKGASVSSCVLNTSKTLARLNAEKTVFTQTLTVTTAADSGKGSLRWCLQNIKRGGQILFDARVFNPTKPAVIYPLSGFSFFTDNITLDASNAGVILDGSKMPGEAPQ